MGDIKAKDLNTAASVAAGDKILGSSINGTTANVTVETVGKYIIDQLGLTSLSNASVSTVINNLKTQTNLIRHVNTIIEQRTGTQANAWEYTGISFTPTSGHLYMIWGVAEWQNSKPIGCGLSDDPVRVRFHTFNECGGDIETGYTSGILITSRTAPIYLFEKRTSNGRNYSSINYIDLGTTT